VLTVPHRYEIVPSLLMVRGDGRTASPYGAHPEPGATHRWRTATVGWTLANRDTGTVGIGRPPWATREEAEAHLERMRKLRIAA
jgi:hypothetical protein